MITKANKFFAIIPIIISIIALTASIYSVMLTKESHTISKTQTLVGKRYEILLEMQKLLDLKNTEYDFVQKIIWTYEDNQELLNKEKDRYSFWKERIEKIHQDIKKQQEIQDKFSANRENNIDVLENQVGSYKLSVNYAISSIDFAKRFLDKIEEKQTKKNK